MKHQTNLTGHDSGHEQRAGDSGRLEWLRWPSGFEVRTITPSYKGKPWIPCECIARKAPAERERYFPEDRLESIVNDFTRINDSKSALRFANRHGFLFAPHGLHHPADDKPTPTVIFRENIETLSDWIESARRTRHLAELWETARGRDQAKLTRLFGTNKAGTPFLNATGEPIALSRVPETNEAKAAELMSFVAHEMNYSLTEGFRGRIEVDKSGRPHLRLTARRLIDWIHLVIAHGMVEDPASVTTESQRLTSRKLYIRFCEECHFPLFARWAHRQFHTDCKERRDKREWRAKRSQAKEA
ncbi:MAG: hypothetical protein C0504_19530 [Candidatus Solibacter sp.]|nr:hypothetical protein [Candidatus Solibacter sp.]